MIFQDGGAGFISQSMKRNSDFDNISVRIWRNSIGEKVAFLYKKKMTYNLCLWLEQLHALDAWLDHGLI